MGQEPIRAVIGIHYRKEFGTDGLETFYIKRSERMENYPGVWTLPSIQYSPGELDDPLDLTAASRIFARMSVERFNGEPLQVKQYLVAGSSDQNPMQRMVELVLYRIAFRHDPVLNPQFYTDCAWLTLTDFKLRTVLAPLPCGLCTRLWEAHEDTLV